VTDESGTYIPAIVLAEDNEQDTSSSDVEEQAWWRHTGATKVKTRELGLDPIKLQTSLDDISAKLEKVLENQRNRAVGGFALESFTVGVAVNAEGKLFMVAEVGIEASIELKFKRRE